MFLQISGSNAVGARTLRDNFQHDFLHLLVRGSEFSKQDLHNLTGVVICILLIHKWYDVAHCFQKSCETFASLLTSPCPKWIQNIVEALDTIGIGRLCKRCNS